MRFIVMMNHVCFKWKKFLNSSMTTGERQHVLTYKKFLWRNHRGESWPQHHAASRLSGSCFRIWGDHPQQRIHPDVRDILLEYDQINSKSHIFYLKMVIIHMICTSIILSLNVNILFSKTYFLSTSALTCHFFSGESSTKPNQDQNQTNQTNQLTDQLTNRPTKPTKTKPPLQPFGSPEAS